MQVVSYCESPFFPIVLINLCMAGGGGAWMEEGGQEEARDAGHDGKVLPVSPRTYGTGGATKTRAGPCCICLASEELWEDWEGQEGQRDRGGEATWGAGSRRRTVLSS